MQFPPAAGPRAFRPCGSPRSRRRCNTLKPRVAQRTLGRGGRTAEASRETAPGWGRGICLGAWGRGHKSTGRRGCAPRVRCAPLGYGVPLVSRPCCPAERLCPAAPGSSPTVRGKTTSGVLLHGQDARGTQPATPASKIFRDALDLSTASQCKLGPCHANRRVLWTKN